MVCGWASWGAISPSLQAPLQMAEYFSAMFMLFAFFLAYAGMIPASPALIYSSKISFKGKLKSQLIPPYIS